MKLNVEATPVNPEPSPLNEPVNEVDSTLVKPTCEAAVAPNATEVDPSVTLLLDNSPLVTFAKAPPNVIVGLTLSPSDDNVIPFSFPVADTDCTVPEPSPEAAIVIPPAEFVTVIFAPPVKVANTGSAPVLPTTN